MYLEQGFCLVFVFLSSLRELKFCYPFPLLYFLYYNCLQYVFLHKMHKVLEDVNGILFIFCPNTSCNLYQNSCCNFYIKDLSVTWSLLTSLIWRKHNQLKRPLWNTPRHTLAYIVIHPWWAPVLDNLVSFLDWIMLLLNTLLRKIKFILCSDSQAESEPPEILVSQFSGAQQTLSLSSLKLSLWGCFSSVSRISFPRSLGPRSFKERKTLSIFAPWPSVNSFHPDLGKFVDSS